MKKSLLTLALAGVLTIGATVLASADEVQVRNGNEECSVQSLVDGGLTFEEAKAQSLEERFARVDNAVANGSITAERGEEIKAEMKAKSDTCTTPGENKGDCEGYGLNQGLGGNGACDGTGAGLGQGKGNGNGNGNGKGMGMRRGSCTR